MGYLWVGPTPEVLDCYLTNLTGKQNEYSAHALTIGARQTGQKKRHLGEREWVFSSLNIAIELGRKKNPLIKCWHQRRGKIVHRARVGVGGCESCDHTHQ